jgi:hypothetical protein
LVPQRNIAKHREIMSQIYNNVKSKPGLFSSLKRSRLFILHTNDPNMISSEKWCYVDEYENRKDYDSTSSALNEPEAAALRNLWSTLIEPGSFKGELWDSSTIENLWV